MSLKTSKRKKVEFFMMLTNRSMLLAKYTIASYAKVYDRLKDDYEIKLICYLNAINYEKYQDCLDSIIKSKPFCDFVQFVEGKYGNKQFEWVGNQYRVKGTNRYYPLPMITPSEGQDEFFQQSTADYFVTVDDDFEILNPEFVYDMLQYVEKHDIVVISTDVTKNVFFFDKHSNFNTELQPRNNTWFCLYSVKYRLPISMAVRDEFCSDTGETYIWTSGGDSSISWTLYEQQFRKKRGVRKTWDNGGWLQFHMRQGAPISINEIKDYHKQYIHYSAFSSNSVINTRLKTYIYRFFCISILIVDNKIIKKVLRRIREFLFNEEERATTNRQSKLD